MHDAIKNLTSKQKTMIVLLFDFSIAFLAINLSTVLRFNEPILSLFLNTGDRIISISLVLLQTFIFYYTGLYKGIWRYSSTHDLIKLIKGVSLSVACSIAIVTIIGGRKYFPLSCFVIDWLILIIAMGGGRLAYRVWRDGIIHKMRSQNPERVVIVGAGAGGQQLFREIKESYSLNMHVAAFVDDDSEKNGKFLHGIKIEGKISDLEKIMRLHHAGKVLIAIPSATSEQIRKIIDACKNVSVEFKILPQISEILDLNKKNNLSQLRNLKIEDLLGRKEINLDQSALGKMISGKVVLVTGAGGSIGSEICHQLANFEPSCLILFEITEYFLYKLEQSLKLKFPKLNYVAIIGDIRNSTKVEEVFADYRPNLLIHAAAYKHVPIMEDNPREAIHTNIIGTQILAELALKYEIDRFVMISTDKAINPTSVMGTSKRVAEIICQKKQTLNSKTKFMTVRFGNVLGSSGSVIPLFKKQIESGGPVTVTHKDIRRYFMSIPEASRLVLQAATMGHGGEIFILEMGEPIYISDLAKQMIELYGLKPDIDIKISYTGLRPGEKLFEELRLDNEQTLSTDHPLVRVSKSYCSYSLFDDKILQLLCSYRNLSPNELKLLLKTLVPEYEPFIVNIPEPFNEKMHYLESLS